MSPVDDFLPGQRWISDTEPELGLGVVLDATRTTCTLLFIAAEDRRTYARHGAPLTRVRFQSGDRVENSDGEIMDIRSVEEREGLLTYCGANTEGQECRWDEIELDAFIQFNKPQDRLFKGQIDPDSLYRLRYATLLNQGRIAQSPAHGLLGARISLIPHQLYIAQEVARRHAPRVLLADEVGLGKTIEAGMILHARLLAGQARRVLIVTPEPLLHQWLVEMLRRFNLHFSLLDEGRCEMAEFADDNLFTEADLILCGLGFLTANPQRRQQALTAGWDLMVVDEAHHLVWEPAQPSPEYACIAELARAIPGVLLLTATPEQLGKASHFARLALLDPDRFHDFARFTEEEAHYESLAHLVDPLLGSAVLDKVHIARLTQIAAQDKAGELIAHLNDPTAQTEARSALLDLLLDRHGTGRILFRNTRATITGFPERRLELSRLPCPAAYQTPEIRAHADHRLHPETACPSLNGQDWWRHDPRVTKLVELARAIHPAKALVICASAQTAQALEAALRTLAGIPAALFHEGLSIVARDRAAAWFADEEDGARILVCSEIGSEGRNFQFAHHLVLFDLPENPDLLEQRIGRLDRIGQRHAISIHALVLENTAQDLLQRWFCEGLGAFAHPCPAGMSVWQTLKPRLDALLARPDPAREAALLREAAELTAVTLRHLHEGRDRLLELNSHRPEKSARLVDAIATTDSGDLLWNYLEQAFDSFGVTIEEHSADCYILTPGDNMLIPHFPGLPADGLTVTVRRARALAREDIAFLTWEHPMVRDLQDLILSTPQGNTSVSLLKHPDLPPGKLFLESIFLLESAAPRRLQLGRFLPQSLIRVLVDSELRDHAGPLRYEDFATAGEHVDRTHAAELIHNQHLLLEKMLAAAGRHAQKHAPSLITTASRTMLDQLGSELKRLAALRKVNPGVRAEEIEHLRQTLIDSHGYLQAAQIRLDAVRVIVTT